MISFGFTLPDLEEELLNLTPGTSTVKQCRSHHGQGEEMPLFAPFHPSCWKNYGTTFPEYRPQKWLFEGETPGETIFGKCIGESAERSRTSCRHQTPCTRTHAAPLLCHTCWNREQTCTRYRNCWDTTTSRPQPFIFMCQVPIKQKIPNPLDTLDNSWGAVIEV